MRKSKENRTQGFVIVLVLLALMAMSFFLMTGAATTTSSMKVSGNYYKTVDSFNLAEVAIAKARPMLEANDYDDLLADYTETSTPLIGKTDFNNGKYEAWLTDNDDGDSDPNNDNDNIVIVEAIGTNASGGTVTIEAHLQKPDATDTSLPAQPGGGGGAAMMCGSASDAKTIGSATISGHDYSVPPLPCVGIACAGTDNGGTNYAVVAEGTLNTQGSGFISNTTPEVIDGVTDTSCSEWDTTRDELLSLDRSSPYVEVLDGSSTNAPLNDCTNPKIFIIDTDESTYSFTGTASLCGMVVVASNTSIEAHGSVTIIGSVLVMGDHADLTFVASTGTPRIFGQIIVQSDTEDMQKELAAQGTAEINFSTEGMGYAQDAVTNALTAGGGGGSSAIITMAWKETY